MCSCQSKEYNQGPSTNHIYHQTLKIANTNYIALVLELNILRNHQAITMNISQTQVSIHQWQWRYESLSYFGTRTKKAKPRWCEQHCLAIETRGPPRRGYSCLAVEVFIKVICSVRMNDMVSSWKKSRNIVAAVETRNGGRCHRISWGWIFLKVALLKLGSKKRWGSERRSLFYQCHLSSSRLQYCVAVDSQRHWRVLQYT